MIYLDHHAATPILLVAREAMASAHELSWANPDSVHGAGRKARAARETARRQLAEALGAKVADIVLAGSGTEALNLALLGLARSREQRANASVVTSALEHPAISASVAQLAREGQRVVELQAPRGLPSSPEQLAALLDDGTTCVAVQWVNHETGTIFPVAEYAAVCAARGVPLVVDACQAFGKLPVDIGKLGATAVVVASAKIGGPAGVSALWHERCTPLAPVLHGGAQERGFRPGTPDVAALAGFGAAATRVEERLAAVPRIAALRDRLEAACVALGASVNGEGPRVGTVSNVSFPGWRSDILVAALDIEGVCVSAGAACSSGLATPSPVLRAMYPAEPWRAESALRISLGLETSSDDVDQAIQLLQRVIGRAPRT